MHHNQKKILIAIATSMVGIFLFPPFHTVWRGSDIPAGYSFIFSPPDPNDSVNSSLLLAELLVALVVGGVAYLLCPEKHNDHNADVGLSLANSPYLNEIKIGFWLFYALLFFIGKLHGELQWLPNKTYNAIAWFLYVFVGIFALNCFDSLKNNGFLSGRWRNNFNLAVMIALIASIWVYCG